MRGRLVVLVGMVVLAASWATAGEPIRWLNVNVKDSHEKSEVKLHVPLPLIAGVVDAIDTNQLRGGKVSLHMERCDVNWLAIVKELRKAPEGDYVTVEQPKAHVVMGKRDGVVTVDVQEAGEHGAHVKVRLLEPLLDALTIDDQNRLDVDALLARLQSSDVGELLRVEGGDADIRVWVE
jgi:hypothetical protein